MELLSNIIQYSHELGYRQVPVWYSTSRSVVSDFQTIGKKLKFIKIIPNPYPFYDWIMGFYERWSNRAALNGPALERFHRILDVGVGTGYLLSQIVMKTGKKQRVTAIDLSAQMLENAKTYLAKHNLISKRVKFKRSDCTKLPYPDESFDLYVTSYLFDLLNKEEIALAINEMERVLIPDGYAIIVTMTTEIDNMSRPARLFYRLMNELYCMGYYKGRWNPIWRFLFAGYAPHCRPIAMGKYLKKFPCLSVEYTKNSRVSLFPVRIYYVRKNHK